MRTIHSICLQFLEVSLRPGMNSLTIEEEQQKRSEESNINNNENSMFEDQQYF